MTIFIERPPNVIDLPACMHNIHTYIGGGVHVNNLIPTFAAIPSGRVQD